MRSASRALLAAVITLSWSCAQQRATHEDCGLLLDRVVALELEELGYRDPALRERKQRELRPALALDQQKCFGRPLAPGALNCALSARSTEELSHRCLR